MPFDSTPTKPSAFSVEGLLAWLDTQDPATEYNHGSLGDCVLARYLRAAGYKDAQVNSFRAWLGDQAIWDFCAPGPVTKKNPLNFIACGGSPYKIHTYAAAAQRCRDYLARGK